MSLSPPSYDLFFCSHIYSKWILRPSFYHLERRSVDSRRMISFTASIIMDGYDFKFAQKGFERVVYRNGVWRYESMEGVFEIEPPDWSLLIDWQACPIVIKP